MCYYLCILVFIQYNLVVIFILCMQFVVCVLHCFFFFKQKTAYERRISDWSSDVCSSDLPQRQDARHRRRVRRRRSADRVRRGGPDRRWRDRARGRAGQPVARLFDDEAGYRDGGDDSDRGREAERSEEHTSELQSLMRISYAVFCLKKKNKNEQAKEKTEAEQ